MQKIKLVIWDLDETFWKGTLSEEGIEPIGSHIKLIKTLTDRGIMNTIVSKNDFNEAKEELEKLGIWEYFIFPKISWSPKGELVKNIIEDAQLRATNVLFLDDNHLNLKEVEFYNPDIHTKLPAFIKEILSNNAFQGKDDRQHSRLHQYKILELKSEKKKTFSTNESFLKFSEIHVALSDIDQKKDIDRIYELVERTNQLNFTKIRSSKEKLLEILNTYGSKKIEVKDKFGDYGIVGFYILDESKNLLLHFVFSCRIMNLGIEQYIYGKLNFPMINVIKEVSSELKDNFIPTWITEEVLTPKLEKVLQNKSIEVCLKGGCDLGQMIHYLQYNNIKIHAEFNTVTQDNITLHKEHSIFVRDAYIPDFYKKNKDNLEYIPFIDESFYDTTMYDIGHDVIVYSVLMDYTQQVYELKNQDLQIAYGGYGIDLINNKDDIKKIYNFLDKVFINTFSKHFNSKGQIQEYSFKKNLEFIISKINVPIIFINGAEINPRESEEKNAERRHQSMNKVVDELVSKYNHVYLLDMRDIIKDETLLHDSIRHYKREVYQVMSNKLVSLIEDILQFKSNKNILKTKIGSFYHVLKSKVPVSIKHNIRKTLRKIKKRR